METVFAAFIVIVILLTGALTLGESMISAQEEIAASWQAMESRWDERTRTALEFVSGETFHSGDSLRVTFQNIGTTPLADFDQWDAIVQYEDVFNRRRIEWYAFTNDVPQFSDWALEALQLSSGAPEAHGIGILNSGEQAVVVLLLPAPAADTVPIQVTFSTPNGVITGGQFTRNASPMLDTLTDLIVGVDGSVLISPQHLKIIDADHSPDELVYTITTPPTTGSLSLPDTFTQADIDAGLLVYQQVGADPDQFAFMVSDGQESIGAFVMRILVSQPPQIMINLGASGDANMPIVITNSLLAADDPDDMAAGLRYSVIVPPVSGYLNLGSSFTQGQIDAGLLAYYGGASDQFQYTLTDGKTTVGPFTFQITVTP